MVTTDKAYRIAEDNEYDASPGGSLFDAASILALLKRQSERRRSRMALLEIGVDQLKDIGLSRSDAVREARRRFWD
ncbi:DUF1127 domain-containing protein [Mesorhizobium sp. B2-4-17]|uniref:DUF1127 domain-containing protein n=1 Tax=Mesorhizobium sp. B2-4-17 TaxID=2589932 RepID=UPI001FF05FE3|nr:DUF1127 domain-containing protein [Mesorhizobium sp. B2-4-17]